MAERLAHGLAQANTRKGEDAIAVALASEITACSGWAVFDGHGGREFAHTIAHDMSHGIDNGPDFNLLAQLCAMDDCGLPSEEAIKDAFWSADIELGRFLASRLPSKHGGCTAQLLLVRPLSDRIECSQAWVGDSTALTVDMKTGSIVYSTLNHNPGEGDESEQLLDMAEVSRACRKHLKAEAKDGRGDDDNEGDDDREDSAKEAVPSAELIKRVLDGMGHPDTSEAHVAFLHRVFEREKLILKYLPSGGKYRRQCFICRPHPTQTPPRLETPCRRRDALCAGPPRCSMVRVALCVPYVTAPCVPNLA